MYTKAANNGHAGAQGRLGDTYENGDFGLLIDKKEALGDSDHEEQEEEEEEEESESE